MRRTHIHLATLVAAGLLAACSSGGGGGDSAPPGTSANVTLAGTAAKGLLANADVAVYPVNADGSVGSAALATGTTKADGSYSLSFTGTQGQPYVVRVAANAGTTHLDEVTGAAQALPAGFAMRSMLVPASTGALTVNATITPLSELAVAAAVRASGGINAANAAQALSTLKQLLGFDPTAVAVKSTGAAASTDEQKLAVLLVAVSRLAQTGALGCDTGSAGDKVKCIVDTLGNASSIGSLKLSVGSGAMARDVSAALAGALTDVLANPALAGTVPSAMMATVMANLGCTTNCAAGSTGGATTVATAIAGSRLLFNEIKSDWSAMFAGGAAGGLAGGAVRQEALAFEAAMAGMQPPVEMLAKDLGALLMGVDLYNDYQARRTTEPSRGRALGTVDNDGTGDFSMTPATSCGLYTDDTATVLATTPAEARIIGCGARYFVSRSSPVFGSPLTVTTEWRHGFTVTPKADGSFDYATRARRRVTTCTFTGCSLTLNEALQVDAGGVPLPAFAGKLTPVLSAPYGDIRSFTLAGELPAAFRSNGRTLANLKHAANLSGTVTTATDGGITSVLGGSLVAYKTDGNVEGTLTVKTGSLKQVAVSGGAHEPSEADLDLVWNAGGSEFEGRLALTDSVLDASQTLRTPTKLLLSGALRNITGAVSTEFLRGAFNLGVTGLANYNDTLPPSASNSFTVNMSFVGAVSATGRPTLEFSFGTSASSFDALNGTAPTATLQYRTLVGSQPRLVVTLTAQETAGVVGYKLSEATSNVSMSWAGSRPATVDLMHANTTKIGTLETSTGLMTFSDGSFMSLDIGL